MVFIWKGLTCKVIGQDCGAVSEVIGEVFMIAIVVLVFSGIALTVNSDEGVGNPEHIPHVDFNENIYIVNNTVQIVHVGGEAIDLSTVEIILYINQNQYMFNTSNPWVEVKNSDGSEPSDNILTLGDSIKINTKGKGISFTGKDSIDLFVVHTPSQQVIQKTVLQRGSGNVPYWITPHPYGSVYDSSAPSGWLPMDLVDTIDDGIFIESPVPKKPDSIYQEYEFGIDAGEMGISNTLKLVELKIIYESNDNSNCNLTMSVYNGSAWTQIISNMEEYHNFGNCKKDNVTYPITQYVKNTDELENLRVKFLVVGNAANPSGKTIRVDFLGVHVEF